MDGEERDDQLGCVAEARVEQAADARPRVRGRVLRRIPNQPGERNERDRGEQEQRDLAQVGHEVEEDRGRRKGE